MALNKASTSVAVLAAGLMWLFGSVKAAGLEDIDHVILFMQENRAFDHYFGTMAGVRGFNDANLQMNGNRSVWHQKVSSKYTNDTDYMTPWYINYLGGDWPEASQCMYGGGNGWSENHAALNNGTNDRWPIEQNPSSIGFFKRDDLPTQFALAEGWVIGDMYQEAVIAATRPNRVVWTSGSINAPGGNLDPDLGGNPYIDNNDTPGCEEGGINCFPLKWKTTAEYYEDAGTSWQVFQDADNFDDNQLVWFENFQNAKNDSSLYKRGVEGEPLQSFYDRAANGTLPEVSYIVGPAQLAEHQPYAPHDGAWLQTQIAKAVTESPKYNSTVLIVSYDETGGWFDHVNPFHSPSGTAGEWIDDPYGSGYVFTGPGLRVPFYIISPWTRNGGVFVEHSDHNSQIKFIEKWQAAKGRNVTSEEMAPWRRENMADLVNAFDFDNPDYSIPSFPDAPVPHKDDDGNYDGSSHCEATYPSNQPDVPYTGNGVIDDMASVVEKGFKPVRGKLTEGRWLTFETDGNALSHSSDSSVDLDDASPDHDSEDQRWIVNVQELGGTEFTLQTASKDYYICDDLKLCEDESDALVFDVSFVAGKGYQFTTESDGALVVSDGSVSLEDDDGSYWSAFSVNY